VLLSLEGSLSIYFFFPASPFVCRKQFANITLFFTQLFMVQSSKADYFGILSKLCKIGGLFEYEKHPIFFSLWRKRFLIINWLL